MSWNDFLLKYCSFSKSLSNIACVNDMFLIEAVLNEY